MPDTQTAVDTASQEHAMSPESVVGYLHSTESGAGVDGPGMRFVFFTSSASSAAYTAITRIPGSCTMAARSRWSRRWRSWSRMRAF